MYLVQENKQKILNDKKALEKN
ncbi:FbpB family small basic protein [Bacillus sp. 3103sda1]|nr:MULTISPECIES: FbpB family small basic protein [unclassified Bacillus (in: firmicutes)]MCP1122314.1 FbpB family small basic protein [Bacillus sp. 3103sda1]